MTNSDLKYWLALKCIPGVGNITLRTLIDAFGKAEAIFHAPFHAIRSLPGIGEKIARQIKTFSNWARVEKELDIARNTDTTIITYKDSNYPPLLLNIYDFPTLLYVKGSWQEGPCIAVVGSRIASPYGKFVTERLSRDLALSGMTVVSGLARGIDTAAHRGALAAYGRTVAVLGCGIDYVYPPENAKLYEEIATEGALVSEFSFGTPPHRLNFPARNRIISGLSYGVVVVEAGERSGSLITARLALEQGREVFAVPGSIDSSRSKGTHKLIRDGAKLVESAADILEELAPQISSTLSSPKLSTLKLSKIEGKIPECNPGHPLTGEEMLICSALSDGVLDIDGITRITGLNIENVQRSLLHLELSGLITRLPGNNYRLRK